MTRKIRLTPLERNVLWMLEEAGEETLATILATLKQAEHEQVERAVATLVRLGYVLKYEGGAAATLVLTASGRLALTK